MQIGLASRIKFNYASHLSSLSCRGVTMVETAIAIPIILLIIAVTYDLARIYTATILCQDVALMAAKVSKAADPTVDVPPNLRQLIKGVPGEDPSITAARQSFWTRDIGVLTSQMPGKTNYTTKELQSLNLAYGYLNSLNNSAAFPIPFKTIVFEDLGGVINCSIHFSYDNVEWTSQSDPTSTNRIFTTRCLIPLLALRFFGKTIAPSGYFSIVRTAYAYDTGTPYNTGPAYEE